MEIHEYQASAAAYLGGYDKGYTEGYRRGLISATTQIVASVRELKDDPDAIMESARMYEHFANVEKRSIEGDKE